MTKYLMPPLNFLTSIHFINIFIFYCSKVIQPIIYIDFELGTILVCQSVITVVEVDLGSFGCRCLTEKMFCGNYEIERVCLSFVFTRRPPLTNKYTSAPHLYHPAHLTSVSKLDHVVLGLKLLSTVLNFGA